MTCDFLITIPDEIEVAALIEKGKQAFAKMDGTFEGNETNGSFVLDSPLGRISGEYEIENGAMRVRLTDKPMMLPCSLIESEFNKYLNE